MPLFGVVPGYRFVLILDKHKLGVCRFGFAQVGRYRRAFLRVKPIIETVLHEMYFWQKLKVSPNGKFIMIFSWEGEPDESNQNLDGCFNAETGEIILYGGEMRFSSSYSGNYWVRDDLFSAERAVYPDRWVTTWFEVIQ